ncbi:MAG: ABC transporter ATP-binding protein, partial [Acidimicrobiales bacterium]
MSDGIEVDLQGARKRYGAKVALDGVDLNVPPGTLCVLLGPSGSGKTTLLRCLAGIERLTEGRLRLGSQLVADGPGHEPPERRNLAMVFQDYALWPHLTAIRNVAFALGRRRLGRAETLTRAQEMLDRVGLGHLADRYPNELSGGEQQRVALARALVAETDLLLFDEPLSNLDAALRAEVRVEIRRLHDRLGATTLYVTHDQVEAMTLADTLWVMNGGVVEQKGAPLEVYERPRSKFVATFLGSPQMNLVDAVVTRKDGRTLVDGGGVLAAVDEDRFGAELEPGRKVVVGVRPHDFVVTGAAEAVATLKVELVEALGFEAFAYGWLRASG